MMREEDGGWAFWLFIGWLVLSSGYSIYMAVSAPENGGNASRDEIEFIR